MTWQTIMGSLLIYFYLGSWSLKYLVIDKLVKGAYEAFHTWAENWEEKGWLPAKIGQQILLVNLFWPLVWVAIFCYRKK